MLDTEMMPHVADIPRVQSNIRPKEVAFYYRGGETTFAELNIRANQVANGLIVTAIALHDRITSYQPVTTNI